MEVILRQLGTDLFQGPEGTQRLLGDRVSKDLAEGSFGVDDGLAAYQSKVGADVGEVGNQNIGLPQNFKIIIVTVPLQLLVNEAGTVPVQDAAGASGGGRQDGGGMLTTYRCASSITRGEPGKKASKQAE